MQRQAAVRREAAGDNRRRKGGFGLLVTVGRRGEMEESFSEMDTLMISLIKGVRQGGAVRQGDRHGGYEMQKGIRQNR